MGPSRPHARIDRSQVRRYDGEDKWDRFLTELAALPSEIRVLGINDYWSFDGYARVRAEFDSGNLPNLEEVFPVLEVRCDTFSGTEGHLHRLNLHLICDPLVTIEALDSQLRPLMNPRYQLTSEHEPDVWSQLVTRESMIELGKQVIAAAPPDKQSTFGGPLQTGFSNLNVSYQSIRDGVASNSALRDHVLLAVGKVEWDKVKWSAASAAQKKSYINSVDAVFTAAPDREAFEKSLESLRAAKVNSRLLDCSDAHSWTDSSEPNRLGACMTWVNADPTFKGLRQALQEYEHRVCTGKRPAVLSRLARSPQSTITDVSIEAVDAATTPSPVFDVELPLNPGFVVVIGNKGQGKSALLDSIALAANSDRQDDFSFLTADRFRSSRGRDAAKYEAAITWRTGDTARARLDQGFDTTHPVRVDYLPQSLIEKVCSADPDSVEKREFEGEIERVVFRHIDDVDRRSATSLAQLLEQQSQAPRQALADARSTIAAASANVADLHKRSAQLESMGLETRLAELEVRRDAIDTQLIDVGTLLNSGGTEEEQEAAAQLRALTDARDQAEAAIQRVQALQAQIEEDVQGVTSRRVDLQLLLQQVREEAALLAEAIGTQADSLLRTEFDGTPVDHWLAAQNAKRNELQASLEAPGALNAQLDVARRRLAEQEQAIEASSEETQALLLRRTDLRAQRDHLLGDTAEQETIRGVEALLEELRAIPASLEAAEYDLAQGFRDAHQSLVTIMQLQKTAYEPATRFIQASPLVRSVALAFDVEFRVRGFGDRWLTMVNRQKLGNFYDVTSTERDRDMLGDIRLDDADAVLERLDSVVKRLRTAGGGESGGSRSLESIMRSAFSPADLLSAIYGLEWLQSQYIIRSEGAELSELSPGQRGLVLLLFYLLVDKSERPLLLDQPEENLDNQTVRNALVPALRDAVSHRQVIAVTHNPNLAVVGDADQIIVAEVDGAFEYRAGSLAHLPVGNSTINVLEGTRAAFTSRQHKYAEVVGTA